MLYTIEGNMTALSAEAVLFVPGNQCNSPVAPGDFDRLLSEYCLIWEYRLVGGPLLCTACVYRHIGGFITACPGMSAFSYYHEKIPTPKELRNS